MNTYFWDVSGLIISLFVWIPRTQQQAARTSNLALCFLWSKCRLREDRNSAVGILSWALPSKWGESPAEDTILWQWERGTDNRAGRSKPRGAKRQCCRAADQTLLPLQEKDSTEERVLVLSSDPAVSSPRSCGRGHTGNVPDFHCTHPTQRPLQDIPCPKALSLWKDGEIWVRIWSLPWDFSQMCPWPLPTRLASPSGSFALCHQHPDPSLAPRAPTAQDKGQRHWQAGNSSRDLCPAGRPAQFAVNHRACCKRRSSSCCEVVLVLFPLIYSNARNREFKLNETIVKATIYSL